MWLALVLVAIVTIALVSYVINVLSTSSGSELKGNTIDDFILLHKDVATSPKVSKRYRYYDRFSTEAGCQLRIVFGTEYGASEDISKSLYRRILTMDSEDSIPIHPRMINCRDFLQMDWKQERLILFIISTSGDGFPPTDAVQFMEYIQCTSHNLRHLYYSVLALGDSNYPHFCKTGIQLDDRLLAHGAKRIAKRHNVDMEDAHTIDKWMDSVLSAVADVDVDETVDYLPQTITDEHVDDFHRNKPFYATIVNKEILTISKSTEDRETVHIEFDLTGSCLTWLSGDALGVYPYNSIPEVMDLLHNADLSGRESVSVDCERCEDDQMLLVDALTKYFNLKDVSSALIKHFKSFGVNIESNRFCGEVRDLLSQYPSIKLSAQQLIEYLKPLQPRYYSISSSAAAEPSVACITVAAVRYQLLGIDRTGVCSVHLFDRCSVGDKLGVFVSRNPDFRLPPDRDTDILMIGPGTGIAPFMSFISERELYQAKGKMVLYFGCRDSRKDFLYSKILRKWSDEGTITLHCAFSRENKKEKVYVQHLMMEQSKDIYQHMQGQGHVYICGDASHMARDVHRILIDIVMKEGEVNQSQATQYLDNMAAIDKYQKDVWVT